jgi:hypothetical protein
MRIQLFFVFTHFIESAINTIPILYSRVVKVDGVTTTIEVKKEDWKGKKVFLTKIKRIYADGSTYKEPSHMWFSKSEAMMDSKHWESIAQMTDW